MIMQDLLKIARPVPGFEGYYATPCGQIITLRYKKRCVLKQELAKNGYLRVVLTKNKRESPKHYLVHRIICSAFAGPPPGPDYVVCHKDNDKRNNNASNLRWDTRAANESDKDIHGTKLRGSRNHQSKLTEKEVGVIRKLFNLGVSKRRIAAIFEVSGTLITFVVTNKYWKHV